MLNINFKCGYENFNIGYLIIIVIIILPPIQ